MGCVDDSDLHAPAGAQAAAAVSERMGQTYPDKHDDILGGPKRDVDYDAIVLENEHLRLVILPALGGKLWQVYDKHAKADSIYTPDVIKPGLIGKPGAWIPGGMEFNFPDRAPDGRTLRPTRRAASSIPGPGSRAP